jgi:hypothetical protein
MSFFSKRQTSLSALLEKPRQSQSAFANLSSCGIRPAMPAKVGLFWKKTLVSCRNWESKGRSVTDSTPICRERLRYLPAAFIT